MEDELFRVVAICKKRSLGDVIIALEGITVARPEVQRIVNVTVKGKKLAAQGNGNLVSMFLEHVAKAKLESITPSQVKDWLKDQGKSPLSYSYVLKGGLAAGMLRKGKGKGASSSYTTLVKREVK